VTPVSARARRTGVVLTGGTVGSTWLEDDGSGDSTVRLGSGPATVPAPEFDLLTRSDPFAVREIAVRRPVQLLSENLLPEDWPRIAGAVRDLVEVEGAEEVLVFHGTDTMTHTAAALAFLLPDVAAPVVLTGANKPADRDGTDAYANVTASFHALAEVPHGVYIVFAGAPNRPGLVYSPTRSRKQHASGRAFASINRRPLGRVDGNVVVFRGPARAAGPLPALDRADPAVMRMQLFPGLDLEGYGKLLAESGIRGVVIELYPSFTASERSDRYSLQRFTERCAEHDCLVFAAVGRHPAGKPSVYETTSALGRSDVHVVSMIPETATVKLMLALGASDDPARVVAIMDTEYAGEFA
jgi:L-asparaginase/Glu-tRNA(Gln) amidotransferase subunit D